MKDYKLLMTNNQIFVFIFFHNGQCGNTNRLRCSASSGHTDADKLGAHFAHQLGAHFRQVRCTLIQMK